MQLLRPTKEQVEVHIGIPVDSNYSTPPTHKEEEWYKDHKQFVLHVLLPKIKPPVKVWKICAEAYLTDILFEKNHPLLGVKAGDIRSFEQILCDGSTFVPDLAYDHGNIKDPWSMGHDLLFKLHQLKMRDVFDKKWNIVEANKMYRDGWKAQGYNIIGNTWYFGLTVASWVEWNRPFNTKIEKVTGCKFKENTGCMPI